MPWSSASGWNTQGWNRPSAGGGGGGSITATYRSNSQVNGGGTTLTLPMPAGAQAGDVLLISGDNGTAPATTITLGGGATYSPTDTFSTSYGSAYYFAVVLVSGDIGSNITITAASTGDAYWLAVVYAISGGSVAAITSKGHQLVSSGSLTFSSFSPAATHVKTVILGMTFTSQTFGTPSGWTLDADIVEVPAGNTGLSFSAASQVSGSAATFTGFTGQTNAVEFELTS